MVIKRSQPGLAAVPPILPGPSQSSGNLSYNSGKSKSAQVRRWIVYIIFVVYWLLIFEGVLRKWALPGMHKFLYFIRDPFVLLAYALAFKYDLWPKWSAVFAYGVVMSAVFAALGLVQALAFDVNPVIVAYGWRNYFLYVPFAFLIGEHFRGKDLARLVRHTLIVSIPIAILCYQQFRAPAESVLNSSYDASARAMLVSQGIVRTSGTFTVSAAQTLYIGSIIAMLFSVWILPRSQRPLHPIALWMCSASTLATFAVSGARSAFIYVAVIAAFAFVSMFIRQRRGVNLKAFIVVPAILIVGALCYIKIFPDAYSAMVQRQIEAQNNEGSTFDRAFQGATTILRVAPHLSLLGAGIGAGTNAASMLRTGQMGVILAEDETQRIIMESGVLGLFYVAYRYWLVAWLGYESFRATKRSTNPLPFILFGYESINLLLGQMTMQGTANGYGWIFAGFCIAANRLGVRRAKDRQKPAKRDVWS